ncbi:MAG: hypothetical protein WC935_00695 [Thermoleophilia bacterium]
MSRVSRAGVSVAGILKSSIGSGLLVLLDVELLNDGPVTIILDSRPE